jgi:hypothetical protein
VTRKGVYRVVSITEGGKECFSVTVAEDDGASERRLPMSFNTRADAEETVAYLKRSIAWPAPGRRRRAGPQSHATTAHQRILIGLKSARSVRPAQEERGQLLAMNAAPIVDGDRFPL